MPDCLPDHVHEPETGNASSSKQSKCKLDVLVLCMKLAFLYLSRILSRSRERRLGTRLPMLLVLKLSLVFGNGVFVFILIKFARPWNSRGKVSGSERSYSRQSRTARLFKSDNNTSTQNTTEYVVKIYSLIEGKFSSPFYWKESSADEIRMNYTRIQSTEDILVSKILTFHFQSNLE